MSLPDDAGEATPFDNLLEPVKPELAAHFLRQALKALDNGDTTWAREAMEILAHELEIDSAIVTWVETKREKGLTHVTQ